MLLEGNGANDPCCDVEFRRACDQLHRVMLAGICHDLCNLPIFLSNVCDMSPTQVSTTSNIQNIILTDDVQIGGNQELRHDLGDTGSMLRQGPSAISIQVPRPMAEGMLRPSRMHHFNPL